MLAICASGRRPSCRLQAAGGRVGDGAASEAESGGAPRRRLRRPQDPGDAEKHADLDEADEGRLRRIGGR
ncbi:MAG: hypothetical protein ACLSVD_16095 [Eggerthellaceae bacterium]